MRGETVYHQQRDAFPPLLGLEPGTAKSKGDRIIDWAYEFTGAVIN